MASGMYGGNAKVSQAQYCLDVDQGVQIRGGDIDQEDAKYVVEEDVVVC